MLPLILSDWTLQTVKDLADSGFVETEHFDFKSEVVPRNPTEKGRIPKTCAAFANSAGGFLVFGVADLRAEPPNRMVGIDSGFDFPEQFGAYPRRCSPTVYWEPPNPPLLLSSGRVIHVVHVPQSWDAPHAVGDRNSGWVFPKRTNQGNDTMDYSEVKAMFSGLNEKRQKLRLLRVELERLQRETSASLITDSPHGKVIHGPLLNIQLLETVVNDTYLVLQQSQDLLRVLDEIRAASHSINRNAIQVAGGQPDPKGVVRPLTAQVNQSCSDALRLLDPLLR